MEKGWKEVYMTAHEYRANMAQTILDENDIKNIVINQQNMVIQTIGEFLIYVRETDYDRAVNLLKDLKQ